MPHYLTTDELIERILKTIATGSKIQVVGTSDSLRDVSPAVTRLVCSMSGDGCLYWNGTPSDVTVRVDVQEGDPRLTIVGTGNQRSPDARAALNKVYDEMIWLIDCCDPAERDAIRSKRIVVTVPPALAAMNVNELARLVFAAVKKATTGY